MVTTRWSTICTVGYRCPVSQKNENPAAHGGVCHLQARRGKDGRLYGRRVNSTGRARETGFPYEIDATTLKNWQDIARSSR